ncbi:VOC family protein [Marinomonas sp. 2405UD68-3]|uniref:VOC family protein n=1 Tax=Marinomonas sp. 2405UD68-3 TaxID=3391835 RepID=UPI0039C99FD1
MYNGILSIDHTFVAVADMDESRKTYEKLGFTVPPRGSHIEWGTGNWCIMFENDYLELRGIIDPERFTVSLDEALEEYGEGLAGVAFGTNSAQGNYDEMISNGITPKPLRSLTRNFELAEGWVQPKFSLCFPQEKDITGLMHVVCCQHLTPELTRKPEFLVHDNATISVISMTGRIGDADAVEAAQRKLLGNDAVNRIGNSIRLTLPSGQYLDLLSTVEYDAIYGEDSKVLADKDTYLGVTRVKVSDLQQTCSTLEKNQVPFKKINDTLIRVHADFACGVIMEFTE